MENNEILPKPEQHINSTDQITDDTYNESESAKKLELNPLHTSGGGVISAVGVDDAQTKVQGLVPPVNASTTTPLSDDDLPDIADDVDLIEKEWVKRAKDVVNSTHGDPHAQNNQINRIKVDYIKKRYNKNIKFKEE